MPSRTQSGPLQYLRVPESLTRDTEGIHRLRQTRKSRRSEEDVNTSCRAPRNRSMILASRGVWAARRTSIVGPLALKERRKGRSWGPEGAEGDGGEGRGPHTGPGVSPDARRSQSHGIRRELRPCTHTQGG